MPKAKRTIALLAKTARRDGYVAARGSKAALIIHEVLQFYKFTIIYHFWVEPAIIVADWLDIYLRKFSSTG